MEEFTWPRKDGQKPIRQQNVFSGQEFPYPEERPLGTGCHSSTAVSVALLGRESSGERVRPCSKEGSFVLPNILGNLILLPRP